MIRGHTSCAPRRQPSRPAFWTLARGLLLALMVAHAWLPRMTHGKTRARLLSFIRHRTGQLEHIFRCLLISMNAAPSVAKPAPFIPRGPAAAGASPGLRRAPLRFSLSLSQLARGFKACGTPVAALENRKQRPRRKRAEPQTGPAARPEVAAPGADPIGLIDARLQAMRALLSAPHAYAGRLATLLKAAGINIRRLKARIPDARSWRLHNHTPMPDLLAQPRVSADTS